MKKTGIVILLFLISELTFGAERKSLILKRAVEKRNILKVKMMLKRGLDININIDTFGNRALHLAVTNRDPKMVKMLLDMGADPNIANKSGTKALHLAASDNQLDVIKLLLNKGARINDINGNKISALILAINGEQPSLEVVTFLLEKGAYVNSEINGTTALHYALGMDKTLVFDFVKILLKYGADSNARNSSGSSPLLYASNYQCGPEIFTLLLDNDADANIKNNNEESPLYNAIGFKSSSVEIVTLLLAHGADVTIANKYGETPLHKAAFSKSSSVEIMTLLLAHDADVNITNKYGETPLHKAVYFTNPSVEIVTLLLAHGANINAKDNYGMTPLYLAAGKDNVSVEIVKLLLAEGADIHAENKDGSTALFSAVGCKNQSVEIVKLLLEKGADINRINKNKQTALHYTVGRNVPLAIDVIKLLLAKGIEINAKDKDGNTALHYAVFYHPEPELLTLLTESGIDINSINHEGETALFHGIRKNILPAQLIEIFLAKDAHPDGKDRAGNTLLHYAAFYNEIQIITLLLNTTIDVRAKNNEGQTALHRAVSGENPSIDVARLLLVQGIAPNAKDNNGDTALHIVGEMMTGITAKEYKELLLQYGADRKITNHAQQRARYKLLSQSEKEDIRFGFARFGYIMLGIFPVTNLIGAPYWAGSILYYIGFYLLAPMVSISNLSFISGAIAGPLLLWNGINNSRPDYTQAGIITLAVTGGVTYLLNLIWTFIHSRSPFQFFSRTEKRDRPIYFSFDVYNFRQIGFSFRVSL